jgi:hypothetical protein
MKTKNMNLKSKKEFYLLSFTWGLPMTLIGLIVAGVLICLGYKPKKWGPCIYFNVGKGWGGVELGPVFITDSRDSKHTKNHEFGHGIQNCFYGPAMPFIVCIPSAFRYWYREIVYHMRGLTPPTAYDDIWFEGEATRLGNEYIEKWGS